jgi:hypothetical protein
MGWTMNLHTSKYRIVGGVWSGAYALGDLIEAANRRHVAVLTAGMSPRTRQILGDLNELDRLDPSNICTHFNEALDKAMQIVEEKSLNAKPQPQEEPILSSG